MTAGAFLAALLLTAAPLLAQFTPPVLPDGLGVNIHFTDPKAGELELLAHGGFRWVRMDFSWGSTERSPGKYDFSAYDCLLAALDKQHIHALFVLDYGNSLYDGGLSPHTPEGRAAFARWATTAVTHFARRGAIWEMWNEPNIGFWKPAPNPDDYIALALAVGKALRDAAPSEPYIGPATSTVALPFLERCFRAGLLEYWSAVSVHPYRQSDPETVAEDYRQLRLLIARYEPAGKRVSIISGEWGYSSVWSGMDAAKQGRVLARQWLTNLANGIPLSIWYDWHDDGINPTNPEHHFGTVLNAYHPGVNPVYDSKPAYLAARTLTSFFNGFQFDKRLAVGGDDDFVLLFARGADVRLAAWTRSSQPHTVLLRVSPGAFYGKTHTGEDLGFIQASGGLEITLRDAPQYLYPNGPNPLLRNAAARERRPLERVLKSCHARDHQSAVTDHSTSPFSPSGTESQPSAASGCGAGEGHTDAGGKKIAGGCLSDGRKSTVRRAWTPTGSQLRDSSRRLVRY